MNTWRATGAPTDAELRAKAKGDLARPYRRVLTSNSKVEIPVLRPSIYEMTAVAPPLELASSQLDALANYIHGPD